MEVNGAFRLASINSTFMGKKPVRAQAPTVSADPLFGWFKKSRQNRAKLRAVGYSDGRITNWKDRGIPRAQVGDVARHMGLTFEQYLAEAGEDGNLVQEPPAAYGLLSPEALSIARAFDEIEPQAREFIREQVFIYTVIDKSFPWLRRGRPVGSSYEDFEKWHKENIDLAMKRGARAPKGAKEER
jgi:hypothetical protein